MNIKYICVCPSCKSKYYSQKEAIECRNKHPIPVETWLMCECGIGVRHYDNHNLNYTKQIFNSHLKAYCKCKESEAG